MDGTRCPRRTFLGISWDHFGEPGRKKKEEENGAWA